MPLNLEAIKASTVLLTAVSDYTPANIRNFVLSLNYSGFSGDKVAFVFTSQHSTIEYLRNSGFIVLLPTSEQTEWGYIHTQPLGYPRKNVFCDRFLHYSLFLKSNTQYKYCISTDCRDVIFQYDPYYYLFQKLNDKDLDIIGSLEDIQYPFENWNDENLRMNFPEFHMSLRTKTIVNAGVIAGKSSVMSELFQSIYLISIGGRKHSSIKLTSTDQSAYNILLSQKIWSERTLYSTNADTWAAQIGSYVANKSFFYSSCISLPQFREGIFMNEKREPYLIVHQYDRIKEWKEAVDNFYI